jgi:thiamine-phosphate diphosphorylase
MSLIKLRFAIYIKSLIILITSSNSLGFVLQHEHQSNHRITWELMSQGTGASKSRWKNPPFLALITEPDACDSLGRLNETYQAIEQATINGGVDLVVVRISEDTNSNLSSKEEVNANKWELLQRLSQLKIMREESDKGFKLIVNNDIDMAINALSNDLAIDGMHVKERHIESIPSVRQQLQRAAKQVDKSITIGTSCHCLESAMQTYQFTDYLFVGTCYTTKSHPEKSVDELEGPNLPGTIKRCLSECCGDSSPIIFAIGGIDETNCYEPVLFGADGVGVIRSVMQAEDPGDMVEQIRQYMKSSIEKREV